MNDLPDSLAPAPPDPPAPAPTSALGAPAVKPVTCPNCGGAITIRAAGYTVSLACPYCSSLLDVANADVAIITRYNEAVAALAIPLGTRGILKGIEWEAIGFCKRSENGAYPWDETLLFNPYYGYRWLVTDGRGWTLGTMLTTTPGYHQGVLVVDGESYTPFFSDGQARVDYVLGEFYWRVAVGETVATADYVRPGFMLSFEGTDSEANWTLGELLDGKEISAAFGVPPPPVWRPGGQPPLPHQPSPWAKAAKRVRMLFILALVAILFFAGLFSGAGPEHAFTIALQTGSQDSVAFGPLVFDQPMQAVTVSTQAPALDNGWVELDYTLVDQKTQARFDGYGLVEQYSGYDSEGSWSEGSQSATTKFAGIPQGSYDLVVNATAQNWGSDTMRKVEVVISIAPGGIFWSNILLALLALIIPLLWVVRRHSRFENARLAQSNAGDTLEDEDEEDDE